MKTMDTTRGYRKYFAITLTATVVKNGFNDLTVDSAIEVCLPEIQYLFDFCIRILTYGKTWFARMCRMKVDDEYI